MYSSARHLPSDVANLLYRNGFALSQVAPEGVPFDTWQSIRIASSVLSIHPETPIFDVTVNNQRGVLVGLVFDPENAIFSELKILYELASLFQERNLFLQALDRLAGRYVLFMEDGHNVEIFHDAIGSRSVFYSSAQKPTVASHAEIVAHQIGTGFADFVVPFLTSRNYVLKDVKYLPGVATSYEDVRQLTPNTSLTYPAQEVDRFWPRDDSFELGRDQNGTEMLESHLLGMASYLRFVGRRPVLGLTAGRDSRGLVAAVHQDNPFLFTYVRSERAKQKTSPDSRKASEIADTFGLELNVWQIFDRLTLNDADTALSYVFRRSSGYYRGAGSEWIERLFTENMEPRESTFIRGSGGEIMRGFYQTSPRKIKKVNPIQLSDAYDINAGSSITRSLFEDMIDTTHFNEESMLGFDVNDLFYWEHRMGTWGSMALSEADLAVQSLAGYNSRNLYTSFLTKSNEARASGQSFDAAIVRLAPQLSFLYDAPIPS